MRRRAAWRLLQYLLAFIVAVAWFANNGDAAGVSTSGTSAKADSTVGRPDSTAARPDSVAARPDSTVARPAARSDSTAARSDSVSTTPSDSTSAVPADSSGAGTTIKPKGSSVVPDTLEFLPPPGSQTGKASGGPAKPKERVGLLGIHPIAILFGLAVLNYFIIKAVSH